MKEAPQQKAMQLRNLFFKSGYLNLTNQDAAKCAEIAAQQIWAEIDETFPKGKPMPNRWYKLKVYWMDVIEAIKNPWK